MKENAVIQNTAQLLKKKCGEIKKIFLISYKVNNEGELTSFKLALILDDNTQNLPELECRLYLEVDCDLPFDLVIYKESEFEKLKVEIGTFAWKIENSGAEIYG